MSSPPDPPDLSGLPDDVRDRYAAVLCEEVIRYTRMHASARNNFSQTGLYFRLEIGGRIIGLRVALCHLMGWDPRQESDKEEAADEYVAEYHNRTYPEEGDW
jgi:hypothetical protein